MNYALKLQTPGSVLSVINKAKSYEGGGYVCGHCLRIHEAKGASGRDLSTYSLALKLMLKKKQNLQELKKKHVFSELVNVGAKRSSETKIKIRHLRASDVKAFAREPGLTFRLTRHRNLCIYDSTRSYDPALPVVSEGVAKVFQTLLRDTTKNSSSEDVNQISVIKPNLQALTPKASVGNKVNNKTSESNHQFYLSSNKSELASQIKSGSRKVKRNGNIDILKILPLGAVKILPTPQTSPKNLSEISVKALKQKKAVVDQNVSEPVKGQVMEEPNFNILTPTPSSTSDQFDMERMHEEFKNSLAESLRNENTHLISSSEIVFAKLFKSYVDVSLNTNAIEETLKMLNISRKKMFWKSIVNKFNFLEIYNIILSKYSAQGDWEGISKIKKMMVEDEVKFNCQTYAALLECLGRVNRNVFQSKDEYLKEIIRILHDVQENGFFVNCLFTRTVLTAEQHEKILQTIREVVPCFEIAPTKIRLNNDCHLLKNLNQGFRAWQSPLNNDMIIDTMEKLLEEQLLLEKNFTIQVEAVSKNNKNQNFKADQEKFQNLWSSWRKMIHAGFVRRLNIAKKESELSNKFNLYIYLKCLPVETYVDVMMKAVRDSLQYSGGYSPSTFSMSIHLGNQIHSRYQIKKKVDTGVVDVTEKLFKKYCSWFVEPSGPAMNTRQQWQMIIEDYTNGCRTSPLDVDEVKWPEIVNVTLGKYLLDIVLKDVKINLDVNGKNRLFPVFYRLLRKSGDKCLEEIKCHPSVARLFRKTGFETLTFDADQIPMVCPPKPWKTVTHGGYLILPTDYVRRPREKQDRLFNLKKVPFQQLYSTSDALNSLQSVPWIINEDVLNVMLKIFQNGGCKELNVPPLPDLDSPILIKTSGEKTREKSLAEYKKRQEKLQQRQNDYGLWCEALYRLSLANHFRKKIFWLPQNFDFRGRVYPVPPHLNHLGSDTFRSLLLFAKGKPLGPNGLDWIKIHTINLTGTHKRRSVEERLEYANRILPEILDSAERPLTGNKWWTESEEPWQTLAGCIEIRKALMSPNPESYISRFPIHQDGSCNGLQHYAALGRDSIGAQSVNLSPSPVPQDVYSDVLDIIEKERIKDAANGVEIAQILEGFVRRKVIKQTIMTTVYGVTKYGAKLQIAGHLEDIKEFPKEHVWKAASYLTVKTFESLKQMFTSAKEIQDWFTHCAQEITAKKDHVQWVSPLGFPIMQPYNKSLSMAQRQRAQAFLSPNTRKEKNAFAPNFVHSLDSSHMMMTSLFCEQAGVTFASIHDCFWTHANTVEVMNRICREQFVNLHSHPILETLSKYFIDRYIKLNGEKADANALKIFKSIPQTGDFDLNSVNNSVYFFS